MFFIALKLLLQVAKLIGIVNAIANSFYNFLFYDFQKNQLIIIKQRITLLTKFRFWGGLDPQCSPTSKSGYENEC
jgi:hypothetical protein